MRLVAIIMKISTWNLQRLEKRKNEAILDKILEVDADIWVFTETHEMIHPGEAYSVASSLPLEKGFDGIAYKPGELRVQIFSKYPIVNTHTVADPYTSVCVDLETPMGAVTIYGTIVGVFGGKGTRFQSDFDEQSADRRRLAPTNPLIISGDFNVALSGYPYPSHAARNATYQLFEELGMTCPTASVPNLVDHIVLSKNLFQSVNHEIHLWNEDKLLSDHEGVSIAPSPLSPHPL